MSTIPDQAVATVIVGDAENVSVSTGLLSPSDTDAAVASYLNATGNYQVESVSESGAITSTVMPEISETYQATFNMQVIGDADTSQIYSDVQQAYSTATEGQVTPSQITVPSYTLNGQTVSTGQAAPTPTGGQGIGDIAAQIAAAVQKFFANLESAGTSLLIGLAAVIIIVVALVAFGPSTKGIASHIG